MIKGIIGSVIGDIAGSTHEGKSVKSMRFKTFGKQSTITDDTVLTMAVAEWMLDRKNVSVSDSLLKWATLYPHAGYGSSFKRFFEAKTQMNPGSVHNGSAMRVSSVGFLAESLDECLELAKESALPSHGSPQAIAAAQATAAAIYMARTGSGKEEIRNYISGKFGYDLRRSLEDVRAEVQHARAIRNIDYETSHERIVGAEPTVQDALIAFLTANSYEETIRLAIYVGGDADTEAAIAGGIAAAYYGVPEELIESALIYIPSDMLKIINAVDGTDWKCTGLIPPKSSRWSIKDIVVYGSNVGGTVNEKAYHLTHKTPFSKHYNHGYPIQIIDNDPERVKMEIDVLQAKCMDNKARWHIHEIGLEKAGYTKEQYRKLFSWALELDNVLVSPTLAGE
jgi:ADP-ribosylglycohydrolase